MPFAFKDFTKPTSIKPGMSQVLAIPLSHLDTVAESTGTGTVVGDTVIITGNHVPATGKGWMDLPVRKSGIELNGASEGETGSTSDKFDLSAPMPGLYAALVEFMKNYGSEEWLFLVRDAECPDENYWQLGCKCSPAEGLYEFKSGTTRQGPKEFTLKATAFCMLARYDGTITLLP